MAVDLTKMVEEWWRAYWAGAEENDNPLHLILKAMAAEIEANREEIRTLESQIDNPNGQEKVSQKLTDQQKSIYLEQHPEQCPFCRSEDIDTLETFDGENTIGLKQYRACNNCKRSWIDYYTLTGVEEEE